MECERLRGHLHFRLHLLDYFLVQNLILYFNWARFFFFVRFGFLLNNLLRFFNFRMFLYCLFISEDLFFFKLALFIKFKGIFLIYDNHWWGFFSSSFLHFMFWRGYLLSNRLLIVWFMFFLIFFWLFFSVLRLGPLFFNDLFFMRYLQSIQRSSR